MLIFPIWELLYDFVSFKDVFSLLRVCKIFREDFSCPRRILHKYSNEYLKMSFPGIMKKRIFWRSALMTIKLAREDFRYVVRLNIVDDRYTHMVSGFDNGRVQYMPPVDNICRRLDCFKTCTVNCNGEDVILFKLNSRGQHAFISRCVFE